MSLSQRGGHVARAFGSQPQSMHDLVEVLGSATGCGDLLEQVRHPGELAVRQLGQDLRGRSLRRRTEDLTTEQPREAGRQLGVALGAPRALGTSQTVMVRGRQVWLENVDGRGGTLLLTLTSSGDSSP